MTGTSAPNHGGAAGRLHGTERRRGATLIAAMRVAAGVVAVGVGVVVAGFSLLVAQCGFAGGRCPGAREPLWASDVFGGVAIGAALVAAGVLAVTGRHSWRSVAGAAVVALGCAVAAWVMVA